MHSCDKQQQTITTLPIAMDAINGIANRDGHNQRNHHEMPKRLHDEPLKCNEEGCVNQPQSHEAALLTNATRAL
jgi:hypothetical protein